jgi:hypothetical protein
LGEGPFPNPFILHPFRLPYGQCPLFEFRPHQYDVMSTLTSAYSQQMAPMSMVWATFMFTFGQGTSGTQVHYIHLLAKNNIKVPHTGGSHMLAYAY